MKLTKPIVLGFSVLAFASASAYAQQGTQPSQSQQKQSQKQQSQAKQKDQMPASELIGKKVNDRQGKEIGEIEDVVINLNQGRVHAVVLSFGGILGVGEKNFAFPMSDLKPGKNNRLTMDVDKQKLEKAQGFAKGQWPAMDDDYWGKIGQSGGAAAGASKSSQQLDLARASELDGKEVNDKSGKNVGEIQDVIVGMNGQVRNIVLDLDEGGKTNIQPNALSRGRDTDKALMVNMTADQLKQQAKQKSSSSSGASGSR